MRRGLTGQTAFAALTLLFLIGILSAACDDDRQRIDAQNTAAAGGDAGEAVNEGSRSVFDVRPGNCLGHDLAADEVDTVRIVPCESDGANALVTSMFTVDSNASSWPGLDYKTAQFEERCDLDASHFLYPTAESWRAGDRTIICLVAF